MSIWHTAKYEDISIDETEKTVEISFSDWAQETHYVEVPIEDIIKALEEAGYVETVEPPTPTDPNT